MRSEAGVASAAGLRASTLGTGAPGRADPGTVLILAPVGRDAQNVKELLERHGLRSEICGDLQALAARVDNEAAAALVTEEGLLGGDPGLLAAALERQPDWSDLPFVFLFSRRRSAGPQVPGQFDRLPARATNVMLLERPLGTESLLSAIHWALGSRHRQFVIRDQIEALSRQAALLRRNEEELAESRGYLRDVLDSAQEGCCAIDREGRATVCNASFRRMLGFDSETDIIGRSVHDIIHHSHDDGSRYPAAACPIRRAAADGTPCHVTGERFFRLDGVSFPVDYRAQPIFRGGELVGAVCTFSDMTERLRAEGALRAANERFGLVLNSGAIVGSWVWDVQTDRFTGDERFAQTFSLDPRSLEDGIAVSVVLRAIHPDDRAEIDRRIADALAAGGPYRAEHRVGRADGSWRWVEANGHVSLSEDGRPLRFPGVLIDISERKRVEDALHASDMELRTIADSLPFLIAFIDKDLVYRFANRAYEEWFNLHPKDVIGRHVRDMLDGPEFALRKEAIGRALSGESVTLQLPWRRRDGRRREAELRYMPRFDVNGGVLGFHVFVSDVTDRVMAAEALQEAAEVLERRVVERTAALTAEIAERRRAEEALRQSQKMEAVGQLTGGIAHDFNNMLTGIIGSIDLMKRRIESGRYAGLERFMEAANTSAHRAASLTHRLLAFSRRQSLDAQPIDVNGLVASLEDLLARTIGEQIALRVRLAPDLPQAHADANQLENALLNLVINARDAMPGGGHLLIETMAVLCGEEDQADGARAPEADQAGDVLMPGRYVMVSVADSGVGMTADVLAKAFEPFYTTKPLGQGTGLGLSMIYGFARQSGGSVQIQSSPGKGTVVRLCLPVADASQAQPGSGPAETSAAPRGEGETVLVVEDDAAVRLLVLEVLGELGYAAIEAADAASAIPVLESKRRIDLLVTDVGLPGMNGRQLAEIARQSRPGLRVLFMTGYAESATVRSGFLEKGMQMVVKPFALDRMAIRIREMIEGRSP
jgi:PAS domain S-box-containing protein